jgi:hypothetical protein
VNLDHNLSALPGYIEMGIELDHLISMVEALTPLAKVIPEPIGGPLEGALEATGQILKYARVRPMIT